MSVRKLNVRTCDLDESLDRAGFRHGAAAIRERIGAERLGAGLYEAEVGHPIWPFHYHHAIEEWMYVISGEPVLHSEHVFAGHRTEFVVDLPVADRSMAPSGLRLVE